MISNVDELINARQQNAEVHTTLSFQMENGLRQLVDLGAITDEVANAFWSDINEFGRRSYLMGEDITIAAYEEAQQKGNPLYEELDNFLSLFPSADLY